MEVDRDVQPGSLAVLPVVRTISVFVALPFETDIAVSHFANAAAAASAIATSLESAGYLVQTTRVIANRFLEWTSPAEAATLCHAIVAAMDAAAPGRSNLLNLGRLTAADAVDAGTLSTALSLLSACDRISMSGDLPAGSIAAAGGYAQLIKDLSATRPDGFGNFQFCVSSNMPAHSPFFPAGFTTADSAPPSFAVGLQHVGLCASVVRGRSFTTDDGSLAADGLSACEAALSAGLNAACKRASDIAQSAAAAYHTKQYAADAGRFEVPLLYRGVDTSLAPSPADATVCELYRSLGCPHFGCAGSLEVSAMLTRVLKGISSVPLTGYCGLMLPPLEDTGLAADAAAGRYTLRDILLHSAVCGIGLDTVPIPGDASVASIAGLLRDVAALSSRWSLKPLSVRVFPVPGAKAGDMTTFDSPHLTNTTVFAL